MWISTIGVSYTLNQFQYDDADDDDEDGFMLAFTYLIKLERFFFKSLVGTKMTMTQKRTIDVSQELWSITFCLRGKQRIIRLTNSINFSVAPDCNFPFFTVDMRSFQAQREPQKWVNQMANISDKRSSVDAAFHQHKTASKVWTNSPSMQYWWI